MSESIEPAPGATPRGPPPPAGEPTNPTVAYERSDVNARAVVWFVTALAVGIAVVMIGLIWGYDAFASRESRRKQPQNPVAADVRKGYAKSDPNKLLPPSPRLEGIASPTAEPSPGRVLPPDAPEEHDVGRTRLGTAAALNAAQERVLNETWEWVDKEHTAARIPIIEAMTRLLAKPGDRLKARDDGKESAEGSPPGRSNSGRSVNDGGTK
jgi:hypothetical protein